jgi:hypothetical protein
LPKVGHQLLGALLAVGFLALGLLLGNRVAVGGNDAVEFARLNPRLLQRDVAILAERDAL